jgi:enoyl-CoA hydratase/carnithine racemase
MIIDDDTVRATYSEATGVGTITLDRPDALNTITGQLSESVIEAMETLEGYNDRSAGVDLRAVLLEGAGEDAFSAGVDIDGLESETGGLEAELQLCSFVRKFPRPVVAKIDGYCLGGGFELALSADVRLATESSRFGLTGVNLGLFPGAGAIQYITKLAGPGIATEMAMTGAHYRPERMSENEIINRVYPDEEFDTAVDEFLARLTTQPPLSLQSIKESVRNATTVGLEEGIEYDRKLFQNLLETEDYREGIAAFREDRDPEFEGR